MVLRHLDVHTWFPSTSYCLGPPLAHMPSGPPEAGTKKVAMRQATARSGQGILIKMQKFNIWHKIDNIVTQLEYSQILVLEILKMCLEEIDIMTAFTRY